MMNSSTRKNSSRRTRLAAWTLAAVSLVAFAAAAPCADAQSRELLNRLVQSSGGNSDASRALDQGRSLIDAQRWAQAASAFDRFISQYPSDKSVDAALFWLAYAYNKQGNYNAANDTLSRLLRNFPRSSWVDDAKSLNVEVMSKLNPNYRPDVKEDDGDDLTIIALRALCENDRPNCSAHINDILRSNKPGRVKEAAIILLGRYGGAEAVPALIQLSRSEPDEKLRMRAIRALGETNDERALDVLREIALGPTYEDESPTDSAIHALANHENPRAVHILGEVATSGKNPRARTHAIEIMSRRRGDNVVDELLRLYDTVPEVQVKKYILAGLANRRDPRALGKLSEVARSSGDLELRRQAVRSIASRGEEDTLTLLLPLYDSERDNELKTGLLEAFGQYQDQRAYLKLEQVVRNPAEPIERRKTAISMLSRSKDPQVLKFLEDMLK
jgi:HEAT repeat protein